MDSFEHVVDRLKHLLRVSKDVEVAEALGLSKTAFSERKKRGAVPVEAIQRLAETRPEVNASYVLTGVDPTDTAKRMLMNFGSRLAELRGHASHDEFGQSLGFDGALIRALESRQTLPTSAFIDALVGRFPQESVAYLLGGGQPRVDLPMSGQELILIANYRAASDEGRASLRNQAAFLAQQNGAGGQRDTCPAPSATRLSVHERSGDK